MNTNLHDFKWTSDEWGPVTFQFRYRASQQMGDQDFDIHFTDKIKDKTGSLKYHGFRYLKIFIDLEFSQTPQLLDNLYGLIDEFMEKHDPKYTAIKFLRKREELMHEERPGDSGWEPIRVRIKDFILLDT